jgi:hypothetical protein
MKLFGVSGQLGSRGGAEDWIGRDQAPLAALAAPQRIAGSVSRFCDVVGSLHSVTAVFVRVLLVVVEGRNKGAPPAGLQTVALAGPAPQNAKPGLRRGLLPEIKTINAGI